MRKAILMIFLALAVALTGEAKAQGVEGLVAALRGKNEEARWQAAIELGKMGEAAAAAAPALAEALQDPSLFTRMQAANALGKIGPKARPAVPQLIAVVRDSEEDRRVRRYAIFSLGEIDSTDPTVIAALQDASVDPEETVRTGAQAVLAEIGLRGQPVDVLISKLGEPSWETRADAARVLAERGPDAREAVPALINAISDATAEGQPADGVVVVEATRALLAIGPGARDQAIESLTRALRTAPALGRVHAAQALGELGSEGRAAIPALESALLDKEQWVRETADEALRKIKQQS